MKFSFQKPTRFYLGNLLILISVGLLSYIYLPIALTFLPLPKPALSPSQQEFYIEIPKINARSPIIKNVNPWNETIYKEVLHHGVAQAAGSYLPGSGKTTYLFAHSSDMPWNITQYNTAFFRLRELSEQDLIIVHLDNKIYRYTVTAKKVVPPTDLSYISNLSQNQLVLQTCTPIGTDFNRLLVFASPI